MSTEAASSVANDSDNLRRSKRKKFRLDVVAAAHGNNQKKSRRDPHGKADTYYDDDDDDFDDFDQYDPLSVLTDNDDSMMNMGDDDDDDEETTLSKRRTRRSTAVFQGYQQDTIDNWVEMTGPYTCHKCPSRYESKSSLANHSKMHNGEKRKFACELCCFSASTFKSLAHHNNVHKQFGVLSPQISPVVDMTPGPSTTTSSPPSAATCAATVLISPPPAVNSDISMESASTSSLNTSLNNAPQLPVAAEEPFVMETMNVEEEVDSVEEDDLDVAPFLEREDDGPPVLEREVTESPEPLVRKSNRSLKPTQKKLEQKKPRGPYAKKSLLKLDPIDTSLSMMGGASGSGGSLPTSSTSSSVTPPQELSRAPSAAPSSASSTTQNKKIPKVIALHHTKKPKSRQRCPHCPYSCSSPSRLYRHGAGHRLREGFVCPIENCHFMCRKAGFLPKHFILHKGKTLALPPKYARKVKKNGKDTIVIMKKQPDDNEESKPKSHKKMDPVLKEKQKLVKKEKTKKDKEAIAKLARKKRGEKRVKLIGQAQIKSFTKVQVDDVTYKKCNIGECEFQTISMTQLVIHKARIHGAKTVFPQHPFLCFTCGYRAKTYAALRTHKLTTHLSANRRFHRTYYLKEIVGDKFFIKYFIDGKPVVAPPPAPEPVVEVVPDVKVEEEEDDGSGDESFDTIPDLEKKQVFFCCNMCPYKVATMNRCQRHYAKHFSNDPHKCQHCSWNCRSKKVLAAHEKLHQEGQEEEQKDVKLNGVKENGTVPSTSTDSPNSAPMESDPSTSSHSDPASESATSESTNPENDEMTSSPYFASVQKWCIAEQIRRPDLEDQFSRKMIDGIKGFQCSDCPYTSKYRGDMRSHKKRHDIDQMYRCVQCTYTTNRPVSLKDHLKQHLSVNTNLAEIKSEKIIVNQGIPIGMRHGAGKDLVYKCNKCPYTTQTLGCLWRHHRNHRNPARINICSNCSYSSIDQRKMEEHTIIHLALGANEPMPFVKRVDHKGRPVSSLTDLNSEKMSERKSHKRKLDKMLAQDRDGSEVVKVARETPTKMDKTPKITRSSKQNGKVKEDDKEFKPSKADKKRKMSVEPAPDSDYDSPGPSTSTAQPTRLPSERATRNRVNYNLLAKVGSAKPTPSNSSADLEKLGEQEENEYDEPLEVSHWKIRSFLNTEFGSEMPTRCPDCPYQTTDSDVLEKHRFYHTQSATARPYICSDCNFSTYTPTALLQHLKLHSEGVCFDPMMKRMQKHQRKGDSIPAGVKGYYCKNCSFKTANQRSFIEHSAFHRHQLVNRINTSLKRQPPKVEYQRPKLKHQFVAKNAKYCKKCTFKCVSQSAYIEHLDRHGWDQLYKCHVCDYSDNNKSVVDFHQLTHHVVRDQTLHGINEASKFRLENGQIQKPEFQSEKKPTPAEFAAKSRGLLKCGSCEYFCHMSSELAFHMSVNHINDPNARESISYLALGLIPPKATVTTI